MTKVEPGKRGPKPKPTNAKVVKKTVSLKPATAEYLTNKGNGVLSKGIEMAVAENQLDERENRR